MHPLVPTPVVVVVVVVVPIPIITNISKQHGIINIRIYNKQGEIKYSNRGDEIDTITNIKDEACYICHRTDPPIDEIELAKTQGFATASLGPRILRTETAATAALTIAQSTLGDLS